MSGTSMAAPHVAAGAILLKQRYDLSNVETKVLLKNTGVIIDSWPRIDILAAVDECSGIGEKGYLWNTDSISDKIYKLTTDGIIVANFTSPGTAPYGLTFDGTNLWLADSDTDMIYKLNPVDGSVIDSFTSPGTDPRGLTFDGTYLWYNNI